VKLGFAKLRHGGRGKRAIALRDDRYNKSMKGRRRAKRYETSARRRALKAKWARAYRKKLKKKDG
jgi:hypothetical protein